jgi:hypothetical protein
MKDNWYPGLNLDYSPGFDFERTAKIVGVTQDQSLPDIDAVGEHAMITVIGEKRFDLDPTSWEGWRGFWNLGIGVNNVDMGDVKGPAEGGGTFDITTKTDTATVIVGNVGLIQQLGEQWSARYSVGFEHH